MRTFNHDLILPWTVESSEKNRFRAILVILFSLAILLSVWVSVIDLPVPDREELERLPPQLAKILVEKKKVAPLVQPKPIKAPEKPEPKVEPKPEEKPKPVVKPPKKKPVPVRVTPKENQTALVKKAREVAKKSGLLALQSDLADLKNSLDTSSLTRKPGQSAKTAVAASAQSIDKSRVLSRTAQAGELSQGSSQAVALNSLSKTSLDETDDERALGIAQAEAELGERERSEESIRLGLEKLKQSLYKLYNRELRKDPFLEGIVMLEIVIESSGEVSYVRVVSSELGHKALEAKFVGRIKLANFGPENVSRTTRQVPINFQPKK